MRDHNSFPEDGTFQIPNRNPFQTFQNIRDDNFHYKASITCVTKTNHLCETRNPSSSVGSCSLKKRWWEDLFQKNTAARARTSARLMGTRLITASEPAHFRLWGAWGHPKALSSSRLSWIFSVCRHRGRHQFFRSRRAKPLWASWMLRVCGHRGRHRFLHSRRAKPMSMHRFPMAGV